MRRADTGRPPRAAPPRRSTPLRDVPQSITVVTQELIKDQLMMSVGDVVRYVPGITVHQGENNRDQLIIRGNNTSADFFVNGVRDDVQYFRDLYNLDRVEALKGPNAMMFGRGGGGGVVNRVRRKPSSCRSARCRCRAACFGNRRFTTDLDQPLNDQVAVRLNGMFENSDSFRTAWISSATASARPSRSRQRPDQDHAQLRISARYADCRPRHHVVSERTGRRRPIALLRQPERQPRPARRQSRHRQPSNTARATSTIRNRTVFAGYDRFYQNYVPGAATADRTQVALTAYNNATQRMNVFNQTDVIYRGLDGTRPPHASSRVPSSAASRPTTSGTRGSSTTPRLRILVPFLNPTITTPVTYRQSATDADNHVRTNLAATYAQDQIELSRHVQVVGGLRFDRFDLQYHNNRNGDTLIASDNLVSPRAGIVFKPIDAASRSTAATASPICRVPATSSRR